MTTRQVTGAPPCPAGLVLLAAAIVACGDRSEAQSENAIRDMARELQPKIEVAVGLPFREPPAIALRSKDQVRQYLIQKLEDEYGGGRFERIELSYRLFRMLPDTLDLRALLLALYAEQVVGYYDPDSTTLYVVEGAMPENVRLTVMHELVHALQGQYTALDSLLTIPDNNDRRIAAQAVMEGQATLVTVRLVLPRQNVDAMGELWNEYREAVRRQHQQMPVFSSAPLLIREGLIFPYLAGADFVRWFNRRHQDTVPFGPRLPTSTEHILHPDRYAAGDAPVELRFTAGAAPLHEDNLGEFETRILLTVLTGSESIGAAGAQGWAGDRYAVFALDGSVHAVVWWTVWDTDEARNRFASVLQRHWQAAAGRRVSVERVEMAGRPAVRFVDAPGRWSGWEFIPQVSVAQ
jgi:hypothetical protein